MSWKLKVKILEGQGRTREEALIEVVKDLEAKNTELDHRLAKSFEFLTLEQINEVVGDLS